ncbi:GPI ethanolamine phosphate transferase 3 isoform X1 [Diabrotica undecimpunctata]|uniref:GPI ethanolamine phosphate transferase 3 isoform X1 n=1 Tax=Diabrotica undecimpunctata TaxID=50387 RepID=UPI003B63AB70
MGNNSYLYFLFLLWLSYLIVSSVLLFTRGFLLTRTVQRKNSTCLSHREIPCGENSAFQIHYEDQEQCSVEDKISSFITKYHSASSVCLPSRTRVVLLIVDALRYDFTVYNKKYENPLPFQNKLPVIHNLLEEHPERTRLYKFIADPPTTTMQRLKALTTGSLPTFIDAGSNFATSEINEDNIIDQLLRHNHGVVFMGDDTWNGLYPHRFTRNFPYPSFNVWDLDTVDNGVKENLYPELDNNDWSLLIGHFLGVDHCGHRYGPNHPEMERKLGEIDDVIRHVVSKINKTENMMLFVIGDHGMTSTGDHGGESTDEITAAMFVYSNQILSKIDTSESVKQIDLVPTLSTLLGIPVPFQNLGVLILDSLPVFTKHLELENWKFSLYSLWANVQQVFEYIKEYAENEGTFDENDLKTFQQRYSVLNAKIISIDSEEKFESFSKELIKFLTDLRQLCEVLWIQFDSYSMTRGLLFIFLTTFFAFVITDGIPTDTLSKVFSSSYILCSYVLVILGGSVSSVIYYFDLVDDLAKTSFFVTGFCSQIMLALLVVQNWDVITQNWYSKSKIKNISNLIARFVLIFNVCGLFSNSYIIEESFVLLFLLVTVVLIGAIGVASKKADANKKKTVSKFWSWSKLKFIILAVLVAIFVRGSAYFWRCRQEQQWCFGSYHEVGSGSKSETTKLQWTITVIFLGMFVFSTKEWLRNAGNMNGYSLTVTAVKFLPTTIVVCMSGYWAMRRVSSNKKSIGSLHSINSLAWSVYGLIGLGILVCILKPLYTYVLPTTNFHQEVNSIPALFKKIKNNITAQDKPDKDDIPVVYGMGTVYSAAFVTIGIYLTLLFALLLGDAVAPSSVIMFLTAAFVLIVTSVLRIEKATDIEQLFDVPNISILIWIILAQYFFYATGHQPSFPNISWEAAFIGTTGTFSNNVIPGTLIILNTFCSYILMGVLLPLLLITPFTVFVMIPSVCEKKQEFRLEASRGEVILFEKDRLMLTSMFSLAAKYILGHAIRVFASMLAATIHCRHLMVWNIFAPKLIFESIGMFITLGSVIVGYLILVRINNKTESLIQTLNKMS